MPYLYLKLLHIIAVIIFLGNIFTGLFWMHQAIKSTNLQIIAHTIRCVIKSDRFFTVPGVLFITAFGFWAAIQGHFPIIGTGWIFWSIILFSLSGVAFMWKVVPLQKKMERLTEAEFLNEKFDHKNFLKVYHTWEIWGAIALATPAAALVMMTLKIPS